MEKFKLLISYSTIALFELGLDMRYNDWREVQWQQGFAWREESVSFRPLFGFGHAKVEVTTASEIILAGNSIRAILVPFKVPASGQLEITGTNQGKIVQMPPGDYGLLYEAQPLSDEFIWCRLTFIPNIRPQPQILRADPDLSPQYPLLMEAYAA